MAAIVGEKQPSSCCEKKKKKKHACKVQGRTGIRK